MPEDWRTLDKYKTLLSLATYMAEAAKTELSSSESTTIAGETGLEDEDGEEIYIDVEIDGKNFSMAIDGLISKAIETARATIEKSGLTAGDIDKIIFIGGPINYKYIRERVVAELEIDGNIEANPMTAVSEGAAIFAEVLDWNSQEHERKSTRQQSHSDGKLGLSFRYESRTPESKARVAVVLDTQREGYTFEISSVDSGWNSGLVALKDKSLVTVPLAKRGENKFIVEVFDRSGDVVFLENNTLVITQTFANVGALLAAHSIGVEITDRIGSNVSRLDYLVREGDTLPAKGQKKFRAAQKLRAGSADSINFKLYQGEIAEPVKDNLFIGALKISGEDFEFGTIVEGAEIICNYTIDDAGSIKLEIDIPAVGEEFYKNFYSRDEAQIDFNRDSSKLNRDGKNLLERVRQVGKAVDSDDYEKLQQAAQVASAAINANRQDDREQLKHIEEDLHAANKILADIRQRNRLAIRRGELNDLHDIISNYVINLAKTQQINQLKKLLARAETLIERDDSAFDDCTNEIRGLSWQIVFYNDNDFVIDSFERLTKNPGDFTDRAAFYQLVQAGKNAISQKNFEDLRKIVAGLYSIGGRTGDELLTANIVKG